MKEVAPTSARVKALVEHFYEEGWYTQSQEIRRLGEQRDRCEAALRAVRTVLDTAEDARDAFDSICKIADIALTAGADEAFERIAKGEVEMYKTKAPDEHPWVVIRTKISDTGWHNHRQTFATEEEARVIHGHVLSRTEPVSLLQHWVKADDGMWRVEDVDVRRFE